MNFFFFHILLMLSLFTSTLKANDYIVNLDEGQGDRAKVDVLLPDLITGESLLFNVFFKDAEKYDINNSTISCHCLSLTSNKKINDTTGLGYCKAQFLLQAAIPGENIVVMTIPENRDNKLIKSIVFKWKANQLLEVNYKSGARELFNQVRDGQQSPENDILKITTDMPAPVAATGYFKLVLELSDYYGELLQLGNLTHADSKSWELTIPRKSYKFYGIFGVKIDAILFGGINEVSGGIGSKELSIPLYNNHKYITASPSRLILRKELDPTFIIKDNRFEVDDKEVINQEDCQISFPERDSDVLLINLPNSAKNKSKVRLTIKNFKGVKSGEKGYFLVKLNEDEFFSIPFIENVF